MTRRLTREMMCKIAVGQKAYGSIQQTQRLFNREFFKWETFAENSKFFLPELRNNASVENCCFQQHGAPAHYARKVTDYINHFFSNRWIGCKGPLECAVRSRDLTPCGFLLWGFLKSNVYSTRPQTLKSWKKLKYHVE